MTQETWMTPFTGNQRVAASSGALSFVGGAGDFDAAGGVRRPDDALAQVPGALENAESALLNEGCSLEDVVRLKVYYSATDGPEEWALMAALARLLPGGPLPVISMQPVVMQPWPGQALQLQVIASRGWRQGRDIRVVTGEVPPQHASMFDSPLTIGLRAGELISVCGRTVTEGLDVDLTGPEQTRHVMEDLEQTLVELGASFADAVKKEGYYTGTTMGEWAKMAEVRASFFTEPGPVATVLPWHAPIPEHAATKVEVLAMREEWNGFDKYIPREDSWPKRVWDWPIPLPYRQGIRLRGSIWLGGQVPWQPHSNTGKPMLSGQLIPQTHLVMSYITDILEGFSRGARDLSLLVCHYTADGSPGQAQAVTQAVADAVGGPLPPLTLVPQPHMHDAGSLVEIWGVARG